MDSNQELAFRTQEDEDRFINGIEQILHTLPPEKQDLFLKALAKVADVPVPRLA